ncbi:glycosyl hydrolase family 18 protein [Calidifontibacillus oryziterrae]|uniref:glycosyl hydrolase family 18 protein n=1 Tax=Calidifontibacillus oryziterrae TaxID=1191699 RepID=UPI0002E73F21|nr:glycosyl hydrolase family 18 protein [Calidifontibacillus oryziterrae]
MSRIEMHHKHNVSSKSKLVIWLGLIFSIFIVLSSLLFIFIYFKGNQKVAYTEFNHPIIYNGTIYGVEGLLEGDEVYLPFSFIKDVIDEDVIFDESSQSIILTTNDQVIQLPNKKLQYFVNEQPVSLQFPAVKDNDGFQYVAAEPLLSIYPYVFEYVPETGAIVVQKHGAIILPATIQEDASELKIREYPSWFSAYVDEVSAGEQVFIEKDEKNYYYIRKQNGIAGFISKNDVVLKEPTIVTLDSFTERKPLPQRELAWPIYLTWEAVYSKNPNTATISDMPGLNVVSPTWFSLKNSEGDVSNLASLDYVKWAKSRGYHVWALFANGFSDPKQTHEALKDFTTRQKIIRQLLHYATIYELDGINIDFENVNLADQNLVTQFVKELTAYLHQAGLVVSMDITFISSSENWSMFYDREKLANTVDYLMVMAYDEHWGSSPVAGSVASLPWVENNLKKLLEVVPNERLILGVPTYTRIWKEQKTPGGNIEVSSKAYSMDGVNQWIQERGLEIQYDEKSGQDYVEYFNEKEQATYKVWLENEKSLKKRTQLVHKYGLAGVASWNRSFTNDSAWSVIDDSLRQVEPVKK